jgi:hypothetical protein
MFLRKILSILCEIGSESAKKSVSAGSGSSTLIKLKINGQYSGTILILIQIFVMKIGTVKLGNSEFGG